MTNKKTSPARDVSDQYLRQVRETQLGRRADAVFVCSRTYPLAFLLIEGDFVTIDRRKVLGLP